MRRPTRDRLTLTAAIAGGIAVFEGARALLRMRKRIDFRDRSVVITGGSRGLGLVIARELAAEGAKLTIIAKNGFRLESARRELEGRGAQVNAICCDLADPQQVREAAQEVIRQAGKVDVLINDAGVIQVGPLEHMTTEDFLSEMQIHFRAPLELTFALLPELRRSDAPRIANITSIGGRIAVPHLAAYSASKFALVGLSNALRAELAKDGVLVTTVIPGLMRTGSYAGAHVKGNREAEAAWFGLGSSLPLLTMDADRAGAKVVDAIRHGDPNLILTPAARLAVIMDAVFPDLTASLLALANRFLPEPTDEPGAEEDHLASEHPSPAVPSPATRLSDAAGAKNQEPSMLRT